MFIIRQKIRLKESHAIMILEDDVEEAKAEDRQKSFDGLY